MKYYQSSLILWDILAKKYLNPKIKLFLNKF